MTVASETIDSLGPRGYKKIWLFGGFWKPVHRLAKRCR
jgi:hypothetical protein